VTGNWQFELLRTVKTIRVRAQEGGKIVHKFSWTGEKFEKENDRQ
jgi:hypothetical protein